MCQYEIILIVDAMFFRHCLLKKKSVDRSVGSAASLLFLENDRATDPPDGRPTNQQTGLNKIVLIQGQKVGEGGRLCCLCILHLLQVRYVDSRVK